ncbi:hypothetical protein BGZ83_005453 [Gryganskiella cystojenkinii]|nr:hypothetical protein BGZ83_005453 [Gryganskiella cystojenkinii]
MPSSDPSMHPISAPILLPGTQQAPTTPPELITHLKSTASSASTTGSTDGTDERDIKSSLPPMSTLSRTATRAASNSSTTSNAPQSPGNNYRHQQDNSNPNSGLRRFPSIGNTKKLSQENITLRAKIVELERYLTGLKEELILAHRQVHGQRLDIKNLGENHAKELEEMRALVQTCEFEMGVKVLEVEDLRIKIVESEKEVEYKARVIEGLQQEIKATEDSKDERRRANSPVNRVVDFMRKTDEEVQTELVQTLEAENQEKEAQIQDLLQKVDRLGTEVLSLEREKAHWQQQTSGSKTAASTATRTTTATSLENLVPITAESIIQATTPSQNSLVVSSSDDSFRTGVSNGSTRVSSVTPPCSQPSQQQTTNSVGYDLSAEHQKLLAKFRALSMQHAQASEYVDSLESENRDLKVQLLDVGGSML